MNLGTDGFLLSCPTLHYITVFYNISFYIIADNVKYKSV